MASDARTSSWLAYRRVRTAGRRTVIGQPERGRRGRRAAVIAITSSVVRGALDARPCLRNRPTARRRDARAVEDGCERRSCVLAPDQTPVPARRRSIRARSPFVRTAFTALSVSRAGSPGSPEWLWSGSACRFRWRWSSRICRSKSGLFAKRSPQSGQAGMSVLDMSSSFLIPIQAGRVGGRVRELWSPDGDGQASAAPSAEWSAAGQLAERYMDGQVVGAAGDGHGDPLPGRAMAGAWDRAVASAVPGCPTNWITSPGHRLAFPDKAPTASRGPGTGWWHRPIRSQALCTLRGHPASGLLRRLGLFGRHRGGVRGGGAGRLGG
jgi:hypothetical protein